MFDLSFYSQLNLAIICWNKEKSFRATRKRDYGEDTWLVKFWNFSQKCLVSAIYCIEEKAADTFQDMSPAGEKV